MDAQAAISLYAQGLFPMDEPGAEELPWWTVDPRTIFELDPATLAQARRKVRRSLRVFDDWDLAVNGAFELVVDRCARREEGEELWLTARMGDLYRALHAAGFAHTFELRIRGHIAAGLLAVTIGRAAMLESMYHSVPHAGNVLLVHVLETLAAGGCELCDLQTPTDHTLRLGAVQIPRAEYERRLAAALQ